MAEFSGVSEARIDSTGGMPRLMLDGKPVPPVVFFITPTSNGFAKSIRGETTERYLNLQVPMAQKAGVHLYSIPFGWPEGADGNPDVEASNSVLDAFIKNDPEALFILRVYPAFATGAP